MQKMFGMIKVNLILYSSVYVEQELENPQGTFFIWIIKQLIIIENRFFSSSNFIVIGIKSLGIMVVKLI